MFGSYLKRYLRIKFFKNNYILLLNLLTLFLLLLLPYYLFGGKLFLGGDDSRLFYAYPKEFLENTQFYSWSNLSSVGWNYPNQDFIPFVSLWSALSFIIKSPVVLTYLAFSLTFILGFIYFQKMISVLISEKHDKYRLSILFGSIFYIFSPILINNHFLNPLIPIWLIGLIPATIYYFIRFLASGKFINVLKSIILITFFSFGLHNIPWILAFLLPIVISLIFSSILFKRSEIKKFLIKTVIFFFFIFFSSSFWIFPFIATFTGDSAGSVTSKVVSSEFTNAFAQAVIATARGVILHPLLNLFHRQIAFDFDWNLKNIYINFYDKTLYFNFIYIIVFFLGLLSFRKVRNKLDRKIFIIVLISFICILYFFTINIGPLFDFYILLGKIPGFVLFRNAYDKFALAYSLVFATLITFCLIFIKQNYSKKNKIRVAIYVFFVVVTVINLIPLKSTIVSPLWTTKNIYKNITIPDEYFNFMNNIKNKISPTNNILSLPYGLSLYSVIKDTTSNNVYVGVSPVLIFSGVNDISGYLSFNYLPDAEKLNKLMVDRSYNKINQILYSHNINYVMVTKNVPEEVKRSYLFIPEVLKSQDKEFLKNITAEKIFTSANDDYELYTAKRINSIISSEDVIFKRINRIKYAMEFKNLKREQDLLFNDSFHEGWKLYLAPYKNIDCNKKNIYKDLSTIECVSDQKFDPMGDIETLTFPSVFEDYHNANLSNNKWKIDSADIKKNFDKSFYKENRDGSINLRLILYFEPQVYFYIGTLVSFAVVSLVTYLTIKQNEKSN